MSSRTSILTSQHATSKPSRGDRRYASYAFDEHGVATLSSVLGSERTIAVNIQIMRAFVRMRELLASNTALSHKLDEPERTYKHHDEAITAIVSAIRELMNPSPKRRGIALTASLHES